MSPDDSQQRWQRKDTYLYGMFFLAKLLVHFLTVNGYGYLRDELYGLALADRLAAAYVDAAPLSMFILALIRSFFGDSLLAIRFPAALAGAATVVLGGAITRRMGGGRFSQFLTCLILFLAPVYLALDTYYSLNAFSLFFWALATYVLTGILQRADPRGWLIFGLVTGIALLNKWDILFVGFALTLALIMTSERRFFADRHIWLGGLLSLILFSPSLIWQVLNGAPSIDFMLTGAFGKHAPKTPFIYILDQILIMGPLSAPVWITGLFYGFFDRDARKFRLLSLIFLILFFLYSFTNARHYYLAGAYPMVVALGGLFWEKRTESQRKWRPVLAGLVVAGGVLLAPLSLPMLFPETLVRYQAALKITPPKDYGRIMEIPPHFADCFGWIELTDATEKVFLSLSPEDQRICSIMTSNWGQASALNFYGPARGLPRAVSGHNQYYLWGPGDMTGEVVIMCGSSKGYLEWFFEEVEEVTRYGHPWAVPYNRDAPIYLCRKLKMPIHEAWPQFKKIW